MKQKVRPHEFRRGVCPVCGASCGAGAQDLRDAARDGPVRGREEDAGHAEDAGGEVDAGGDGSDGGDRAIQAGSDPAGRK